MLESTHYLKTVIETMRDGLMVVDTNGEIVSVNRAMEELTGFGRDELIGAPCSILQCDTCFRVRMAGQSKHCELFLQEGIRHRRCELRKKDGTPLPVLKNAAVLKDQDGSVIGGVETITDLSDLDAKEKILSDLKREMGIEQGFQGILGKSKPMLHLFGLLSAAAESEAPVLIIGESGTGKELAAKAIHKLSPRSAGPFVTVNCAALNDDLLESELFGHVKGAFTGAERHRTGRFEASHGGDIFLDEIGDIPLSTQVKLLRVLQEKMVERVGENKPVSVDVRIISATNKDLKKLMSEERFREDLYYRIGVIPIHLPPLRERREDIPLLVESFINRISIRSGKDITGISHQAMVTMINHDWPGNIRELINALEYAFVLCKKGAIGQHHLPADITESGKCAPPPEPLHHSGIGPKEEIITALEKTGGRKGEAAKMLGVSRVTLWKRMKKFELDNGET